MLSDRAIKLRTYIAICVLLVLLTSLTVSISFLHLPSNWHLALGLSIGGCKAALVVLFFMHALISDRLTWIVIIVVCFWIALFYSLTLTDYLTRNQVPFMSGH